MGNKLSGGWENDYTTLCPQQDSGPVKQSQGLSSIWGIVNPGPQSGECREKRGDLGELCQFTYQPKPRAANCPPPALFINTSIAGSLSWSQDAPQGPASLKLGWAHTHSARHGVTTTGPPHIPSFPHEKCKQHGAPPVVLHLYPREEPDCASVSSPVKWGHLLG